MNAACRACLATLLFATACPALAESEAMQRERALNRILVAERHEREREAAARGNGLIGIKPAARPGDAQLTKKPPRRERSKDRQPKS
jgi:hypothetical protein